MYTRSSGSHLAAPRLRRAAAAARRLRHANGIRYRLIPRQTRREHARQEALRQFAAHGLQHTELRTGVLIFVSLAERYAEVIADARINQKVEPEAIDRPVF